MLYFEIIFRLFNKYGLKLFLWIECLLILSMENNDNKYLIDLDEFYWLGLYWVFIFVIYVYF